MVQIFIEISIFSTCWQNACASLNIMQVKVVIVGALRQGTYYNKMAGRGNSKKLELLATGKLRLACRTGCR